MENCPAVPEGVLGALACQHILQECTESASYPYLQLYYCLGVHALPAEVEWLRAALGMSLVLGALLLVFSALGLVAGDFFCPNLSSLGAELGLSDSTVGVTLLAFGNGFPDVVSTFRAMQKNAGAMALGELMGAAVFTVSMVCGSIMVFYSFRVHPYVLLRDVGVFAVALTSMLYFLQDGKMGVTEGLAMVALYSAFVFLVFFGDLYVDPERGAEAADAERIAEQSPLLGEPMLHVDHTQSTTLSRLPVVSTYEVRRLTRLMDDNAGRFLDSPRRVGQTRHASLPVYTTDAMLGDDMARTYSNGVIEARRPPAQLVGRRAVSPEPARRVASPIPLPRSASPQPMEEEPVVPHIRIERPSVDLGPPAMQWRRVWIIALFPSLVCWEHRTLLQRVAGALSAPALLVLRVTVPLMSREEFVLHKALSRLLASPLAPDASPTPSECAACDELGETSPAQLADPGYLVQTAERTEADRVLMAVQCALCPAFALWVLAWPAHDGVRHALMAASLLLGGALGCALAARLRQNPQCHSPLELQRYTLLRSSVGFLAGLLWIIVSVDEVLAVLHALGYIYGWSEAILGLTLFAMGNSLGDVVTNLTIAHLGHPLMALSACFASPLTNLLLGMGASATWMQLTHPSHGPYYFPPSVTLQLSSRVLLGMLLSMLVVIPLNGFRVSRHLGYVFLACYVVVMSINVYLETHSVH